MANRGQNFASLHSTNTSLFMQLPIDDLILHFLCEIEIYGCPQSMVSSDTCFYAV